MELTPREFANLDYLYKKYVASKAKTDSTATSISADTEQLYTFPITRSSNVWIDSEKLLNGPNGPNLFQVIQYQVVKAFSIHGVGNTQDFPALTGFSWNSGIKNWIDSTFNIGFMPTFYIVPKSITSPSAIVYNNYPTILANDPTYPFIFDYQSGILTFTSAVPISSYYQYNLTEIALGSPPYLSLIHI